MRVLITGAGGFVGSHCLSYFLDKTNWEIIAIDSFRHKGTYSRLSEVGDFDSSRVKVYNHDLTVPIDNVLENRILERTIQGDIRPIDSIINFASDSAVERSVSDPVSCWRNNCELIINMLEFARKVKPRVFMQISSDEVYGEAYGSPHKEWDVIMPSNIYSASKASQEAASIAYWRSFGVPVVIMNIMNMIGEGQDKEKFLPKLIWKIATDQEMEIYGEPGKIGSRFYLYCKNLANALIFLMDKTPSMYDQGLGRCPDRYNISGDMEMNNLEVAQYVAKYMGKELKYKLIPSESARPGYDRRYALDATKILNMGWKSPFSTLESIRHIVRWTMANPHWI